MKELSKMSVKVNGEHCVSRQCAAEYLPTEYEVKKTREFQSSNALQSSLNEK